MFLKHNELDQMLHVCDIYHHLPPFISQIAQTIKMYINNTPCMEHLDRLAVGFMVEINLFWIKVNWGYAAWFAVWASWNLTII